MAIEARRLAVNPFGDQYPDDNIEKEIEVQADGLTLEHPDDRHVLLHWFNGTDPKGNRYTQIIHLTGGPGNYQFHTPQVKMHSERSTQIDTSYVLGKYTRAQRDQIIGLAGAVEFNKKSYVNNCQTWMRDLLEAMVNNGLLSLEIFNAVDADVPLKKRVPELQQVQAVGAAQVIDVPIAQAPSDIESSSHIAHHLTTP